MELQNKKMSNDEFYAIQKEILTQWPTGADVDFANAVEFHQELPDTKNFSKKLAKAKREGKRHCPEKTAQKSVRIWSGGERGQKKRKEDFSA